MKYRFIIIFFLLVIFIAIFMALEQWFVASLGTIILLMAVTAYLTNEPKKKIYFGHPTNTYNTPLEKELIEKIEWIFPEYEIENPNQPHHSVGYDDWLKKTGSGMNYYYEKVLPSCHMGIFLPFRDGKFGAGVAGEIRFLKSLGCNVLKIHPQGMLFPLKLREEDVLSIEETKKRIKTKEGKAKPY